MQFDLLAFTLSPTTEVFHKCSKKDLILIAELFNLEVPRAEKKQVIKVSVFEHLVPNGILPEGEEQPAVPTNATAKEVASGVNATESENFDPALSVRLKELDLEVKKQENENLHLKLRVVEAETTREVKPHTLALLLEEMSRKPIPLPRSRLPSALYLSKRGLIGKAQEICTLLPIEQSLDEVLKVAVLRAYEPAAISPSSPRPVAHWS